MRFGALLGVVVSVVSALVSGNAVASHPAASHPLLIRERGYNKVCLARLSLPPLGRRETTTDDFQLRAPGSGFDPIGRILARDIGASWTPGRCGLDVRFHVVRVGIGRFSFYDKTTGDVWYDQRLPRLAHGRWTLTVTALGRSRGG